MDKHRRSYRSVKLAVKNRILFGSSEDAKKRRQLQTFQAGNPKKMMVSSIKEVAASQLKEAFNTFIPKQEDGEERMVYWSPVKNCSQQEDLPVGIPERPGRCPPVQKQKAVGVNAVLVKPLSNSRRQNARKKVIELQESNGQRRRDRVCEGWD